MLEGHVSPLCGRKGVVWEAPGANLGLDCRRAQVQGLSSPVKGSELEGDERETSHSFGNTDPMGQ